MAPIAVLGAGGQTGAECVAALEQQGKAVRAVVRDPSRYADKLGTRKGVEITAGDVSNKESLHAALQGCGGVIFAAQGRGYWSAKGVDFQGVANVAEVAAELGGKHVVLVSSALVSPHNRFHPIRVMLNNFRWSLMDNKWKGEEALRGSGAPYTIVRPGGLTSEPAGKGLLVAEQGDKRAGRISRADVAAVCVAAHSDPAAKNVTLELLSETAGGGGPPPPLQQQLKGLFKGLQPDPRSQ